MVLRTLALLSSILLWFLGALPVQPQSIPPVNVNLQVIPPPPPDIGEPGQRSSAGSRGCDGVDTWHSSSQPLTAIAPIVRVDSVDLVFGATFAERPTLWFYVPYGSPYVGMFVLQDQTGTTVHETLVTLPEQTGVISLPLPASAPALEINQPYHWYFKIYCQSDPQLNSQPDAFVDGWIQRNSMSPTLQTQLADASMAERFTLYAANGAWFDALAIAAEARRVNANDTQWAILLRQVGLENLVGEPIGRMGYR